MNITRIHKKLEEESMFQTMAWTFYDVDGATYIIYKTFNPWATHCLSGHEKLVTFMRSHTKGRGGQFLRAYVKGNVH